ncbi:MAG: hypothetical protein KF803_18150 [Cyclobacteriaceae bacterium]|nr:hypothetical protein [Cyclobacteriaceae bacterium]
MARAFLVVVGVTLLLSACTQKVICPAYQSAFIYDKESLRQKYSYFNADSTPKVLTASKNKFLVAEATTYKKKNRSLQTVVMKPVNPVVPDSILMGDDALASELDRAARSIIDSTYIVDTQPADTVEAQPTEYVITKDREVRVLKHTYRDSVVYDSVKGRYDLYYVAGVPAKPQYHVKEIGYNVEQDNYMWYLRDVLILPDVRLAQQIGAEKARAAAKKEKKGFFKNLFKRKSKSTEAQSPQQLKSADMDEYNFDEFDDVQRDTTAAGTTPAKKKKGLSLFKKKDKTAKNKKTTTQPEEEPAKKEEEEDDGF